MNNRGRIICRDIFQHKLKLIEENARRLKIDIIDVESYDALKLDERLVGKVDYVLLDAPCSGLGLIRRKPEIKWNRTLEDIKDLSKLQYDIINVVKSYVKAGGVLLYSTCTIERKENIDLINRFLRENPEFKLLDISDMIKGKENLNTLNEGYIQLYPHIHGTDGFFIVKMVKER